MGPLPIFEKGHHQKFHFKKDGSKVNPTAFSLFFFLAFLFFFIIILRLFQLTVVKGTYYRRLSEENRIRSVVVEPQRGALLDRKGLVIAKTTLGNVSGAEARISSQRVYENPEAIAHFVGYRQTADKQDLENDLCLSKLKLADKVGKKGVEKVFECELRGRPGKKLIELDAHGKYVRTLSVAPPQAGKTLHLSLDLMLQKKAYELLNPPKEATTSGLKKGAVIALNPKTGEILALVSSPSFSPQDFEDGNDSAIHSYLTDRDHPLFNRLTEGTYPPGSVFKIFIATGALEEKKITEDTQFVDAGSIEAGGIKFGNWYFLEYGKTEGALNIVRAIKRSNDIFFYKTGEKLGPIDIKSWAQKFGFGKKNNFPFEQSEGIIPSPFWKEEVLKDQWYLGDTYNLSIGQGYLLVTPLQVAMGTIPFANDGKLCAAQLLKDPESNCKSLGISEKTLKLVREGMRQACSPGGTGWPLFDFKVKNEKIQTACKTGTAESLTKHTKPHAWITVFAPYENPEIVVTVLVEEGGQGSDVAGPIAKELLETYFGRTQ